MARCENTHRRKCFIAQRFGQPENSGEFEKALSGIGWKYNPTYPLGAVGHLSDVAKVRIKSEPAKKNTRNIHLPSMTHETNKANVAATAATQAAMAATIVQFTGLSSRGLPFM